MLEFQFFFNSILLGVGLAMDAFSVSLANGLNEPLMKKGRTCAIAGVFSFFQFAMPLIGWICVRTVAKYFYAFEKAIPYIALILLCFIGVNMIIEGVKNNKVNDENHITSFLALLVQGVATSIDALSVGFTISNYGVLEALVACLIIGVVTFGVCFEGLLIGKKFGTKLMGKANLLGGIILIFIGFEIFITGIIC